MGRIRRWTEKNLKEWTDLRQEPAFKAVEIVASKGLKKVEKADLEPLLAVSPCLSDKTSLASVRQAIRAAVAGLAESRHAEALLALLRATTESEAMSVESAIRLSRVMLGQADAHVPKMEQQLGRRPTALELIPKLPADNANFRKAPQTKRAPGDYFFLLRELYEELVPWDIRKPQIAGEHSSRQGERNDRPSIGVPIKTELDIIKDIAQRHYGTTLELTQLARIFLTEHDVIESLNIDITLTDDTSQWYRFSVTRDFSARFTRYTVGVVIGDDARAALMRCIPELKDIIWLPPETPDLDASVDELIQDGLLEIRDRSSQRGYRPAPFEPIPDGSDLIIRLERDGTVEPSDYRLLHVALADEAELMNYRSTLHMRLNRGRRRCAWFADGPTFVNKINIDLTGFTDAATSSNTNVYFFLPGTASYSKSAELGGKLFERTVSDWVFRHHGFAIHW
jgi:hypothetical protein